MPVVLLSDLCKLAKPVLAALLNVAKCVTTGIFSGNNCSPGFIATTDLSVQQGLQKCYLLTVAVLCFGL